MSNFASFQVARVASMISELFLFSLYDLPFPSEIHQNKNLPLRQIHLFEVPVFQDFLVNSVCDFYICTDRELILPSRCLDLSLEVSRLSGLRSNFYLAAHWPASSVLKLCDLRLTRIGFVSRCHTHRHNHRTAVLPPANLWHVALFISEISPKTTCSCTFCLGFFQNFWTLGGVFSAVLLNFKIWIFGDSVVGGIGDSSSWISVWEHGSCLNESR